MAEIPATNPSYYDFLTPDEQNLIPYLCLEAALKEGDWAVAREVISALPETLDGFSTDGVGHPPDQVPLFWAAHNGAAEFTAWLLARGATPDARTTDSDQTPLWMASWLARGSWTVSDPDAAKFFRVIRLLIDAGANPDADCGGSTPDSVYRRTHGIGLRDALAKFERRHGAG